MTLTSGFRALIAIRADSTLRSPDPVGRVDDLALEVGQVDDVEVDETDGPDPGRREIQRRRAAEAAGADEQRLRGEQPCLAGRADLRDEQVAAVALLLLGVRTTGVSKSRPAALPALEPAAHRLDVGVAHLGERLGREQRAHAAGAVQDHRGLAVGRRGLDLLLDVGLGDVLAPGMWPCSHSDASRTSTIVAAPAGRAATSWG